MYLTYRRWLYVVCVLALLGIALHGIRVQTALHGDRVQSSNAPTPLIYMEEVTTTSAVVYCAFPNAAGVAWDRMSMELQYWRNGSNTTQTLQVR
jgi:hypothetical protein